jgi:hypothetical protein
LSRFEDYNPSLESYWRAIILFGRNVASYKFALAKSLLDIDKSKDDIVTLSELAEPFSRHVCEHLKLNDKQATSSSSQFLDTCRAYNTGKIDKTNLIDSTVRLGFVNVIDAFHNVNNAEIPERFFIDSRGSDGGIKLTDNIFKLYESSSIADLPQEVEARWRLVESAWSMNIARNLITVQYDNDTEILFANSNNRRTNITSSRDALNGYQKGKCFYCNGDISVIESLDISADVDHFFPHILKEHNIARPIDGVWNLVLACRDCNRGENGKFAKLPKLEFLDKLSSRNNYLITSHHPLRETLLAQTGNSEQKRHNFLQTSYKNAKEILIHTWEPTPKAPDTL